MNRVPAGGTDTQPPRPASRGSRRALAAGLGLTAVLLAVIAFLALDLSGKTSPASTRSPGASPSATATPTLAVPAIYQRVAPSVVVVVANKGAGARATGGELGTGVIVADSGTILTARHVIAGAKSITVAFADGTKSPASIVSADPKKDIAFLAPSKLPQVVVPANLGGVPTVGSQVVAIGNPLGLDYSVSSGVVSGLDRPFSDKTETLSGLIQFDASVNPGNSGGPLLDARGLVVGIVIGLDNSAGEDAFAGIGFAEPIGIALGGGGTGRGPQI